MSRPPSQPSRDATTAAEHNTAKDSIDADDVAPDDGVEDPKYDIRSRDKSDVFHEHYNAPLKKDCPASSFFHCLFRHATFAIDEEDENKVKNILASKGIKNFNDHWFFNKSYWYARVRMYPRSADDASSNLFAVLDYLKGSDAFKKYVTEDVTKHIVGWAKRCRHGRYEDLPDVHMYDFDGCDSDGLDTWISRRGSKAENFHQKMKVAAGPWGMGVPC